MRILFDLDGVLVDLHRDWLEAYNRRWSDDLTVERLSTYRVHEHVRPECGHRVYDIIKEPHFFDYLPAFPAAVEAWRALREVGHELRICSTPVGEDSAGGKLRWVRLVMGLDAKFVHLCGEKEYVDADVIIDDSPEVLRAWRARHPDGLAISMGYPYNDGPYDNYADVRAADWRDQRAAWSQILAAIDERALRAFQEGGPP